MKKYFVWCIIFAVLSYALALVIGGALIPHYSHINQVVSQIAPLISTNYKVMIGVI